MARRASKPTDADVEQRLRQAVEVALAREVREQVPAGRWDGRVWTPAPGERRPCCEGVHASPVNRQALEAHCRSQVHVAHLFDVPVAALKQAVRAARRAARPRTPAEMDAALSGIEALIGSSRTALCEARKALREEAGHLDPFLAELRGPQPIEEDTAILAELLERMERMGKLLTLFQKLAAACREAQGAGQTLAELGPPSRRRP